MSKAFPTPWTFEADDTFEDSPIRAANGERVLVRDNGVYPPDLETCREIVDAVNQYKWANEEIHRLLVEKDNMFDEATGIREERDHLRDLVKRLITVHENIYWRKDETTGMLYVGCAIDEEKIRKTIEEARDALKTSEQCLEE